MIDALLQRIREAAFRARLQDLLVELCAIDTTPHPDPGQMRGREAAAFAVLERELRKAALPGARIERRPMNPAIERHPAYTPLHYTKTAERPEGLSAAEAYAGRCNLLLLADGDGRTAEGRKAAANAHVDVVAPYFPPRVEGGVVFGRGACDDKGPVVALVGAVQAIAEQLRDAGRRLNRELTCMFVIEEETGGNGSLSLALDRELRGRYDSLVVLECCDHRLHPANRGAVWHRFELAAPDAAQLEMAAFVVEQLELEGRAIRAESRHPLFPQRPVQTCHGIMDRWGEHPSRICGRIDFRIDFARPPDARVEALLRDCLETGLAEYIGWYGDKTKVTDPATGRSKVARHYDLRRDGSGWLVAVHGATGHMGAIEENDGAITKMAAMVRALARSKAKIEAAAGGPATIELAERADPRRLVLEGGQGFVPTHPMDEVMRRMTRAAQRGAEAYYSLLGRLQPGAEAVRASFDKLHNAAYDGDPDSPTMRNAVAAAKACGVWRDEPIRGWTVSCDARLFANEYPGLPVITTGPGELQHAHSDEEQLRMDDLIKSVEFLAVYLLLETGTVPKQA